MSKKNKYYISCGTGKNQLPLIQAAKTLGYKVAGVDQNIYSEGMKLCDLKIEDSILNSESVCQKLLENLDPFEIIGGFSASYGTAIASWAQVAERLHLHGLPPPLAETLLDKLTLRKSLESLKKKFTIFEQPNFIGLSSRIVLDNIHRELDYPIIFKPRSGHSKKNIFIIVNKKDLKTKINKLFLKEKGINPKQMILENFIQGNEITVVGFVQNFTYHIIFMSNKLTAPHPPFIEIEHSFPSIVHHLRKEIEEMHQKIVDILQISCSPIVSEWKYYQGKLYLVELSPQIPGEQIGDYLIPRSLHYPYFLNLVKLTTGQSIDLPRWNKIEQKKMFRVRYWVEKPNEQVSQQWHLKADFFYLLNENPAFPPRDNRDRYGVFGFVS